MRSSLKAKKLNRALSSALLSIGLLFGAAANQAQADTSLILLGTAGGPTWYGDHSPHGISSAVMVNDNAYLVDFGSGAFRQMRKAGIKPGMEKALFITHMHTDHVIDLPTLLMYDPSARRRAKAFLEILGPGPRPVLAPLTKGVKDVIVHEELPHPGTEDYVNTLVASLASDLNIRIRNEGIPDLREFFSAKDIKLPADLKVDPDVNPAPDMEPFVVWQDENVKVSAILVAHGLVFPNFAYRFDTPDGSIVFSGDTAVDNNLIRLAQGADILVHEAIDPEWVDDIVGAKPWDDRQKALAHQLLHAHATPTEVGEVATKAGVKKLVLSHLVPGNAPKEHWARAAETFAGPVVVGEDLMKIKLKD